MNYHHHKIEEVIQVLQTPKESLSYFLCKYKDNQEMLDLYEELRRYKEAGLQLEQINAPEVNREWGRFTSKQHKKKQIRRSWLSAASILLIASFSGLFTEIYFRGDRKQVAQEQRIQKGNPRAILISSSGQEYKLEEGEVRTIRDQHGVKVQTDSNNVIQYSRYAFDMAASQVRKQYNILKVPRLGEYQIVLSDGSKVWINSESELKYPIQFNEKERVVELVGEAYFDVKTDPRHPFIVKANGVNTKVLGTEFNVSSYPMQEMNITLVEGSVSLSQVSSQEEMVLQPGENANQKVGEKQITRSKVDVRKYTAWRDGYFYFQKERLEDILLKLERWYDFKVFYQNQGVKDYLFKMRADRKQDFKEIVSRLEQTGRISIETNGNVILVSDVSRK